MKRTNSPSHLYTVIIYICGLFLFLEWLYPLEVTTDTTDITVFIIFAVFSFLISLFQIRWWIAFLLKGFGILFIIHALYFDVPFFHINWVVQWFTESIIDWKAFFSQQWYSLTNQFRSTLLLGLIWLMSYLIFYWFVEMKRIFLFIMLTFVFITVVDTFTAYDATFAIIRIFLLAFFSLGITNVVKKTERENILFSWKKHFPNWVLPLIVLVVFSTAIGYSAPKSDPQWPDPVPFIKSASLNNEEESANSDVRKVGYGEDDSKLGGSFEQDNTPVFRAIAEEKQYWRVETKDVYTGKGWESSENNTYEKQDAYNIALDTFKENVETTNLKASISFQGNAQFNKLVYPYGINSVQTEKPTEFLLNLNTEAIETVNHQVPVHLTEYLINYKKPHFSIDELQKAGNEDPQHISDRYTQLPTELPDRVYELALDIIGEKSTRYEKVLAIERYFSRNGYVYDTTNVPIPEEEDDYVDQFLFDSKRGYCDNYSTSMVVLLRTLNIPARWAKGFTGGEQLNEIVENKGTQSATIYEITNANAHSWVEVYFPEIGWVPFEPTQGFSNLTDFYTEGLHTEESEEEIEEDSETNEEETEQEEEEQASLGATHSNKWLYLSFVFVFILITLAILYKYRLQIQMRVWLKKLQNNKDETFLEEAYLYLLNLLHKNGFKKRPDQTLREYAQLIDEKYETKEMTVLTKYYEQMLYSDTLEKTKTEMFIEAWEKLSKRLL